MKTYELIVNKRAGLHARISAQLEYEASKFKSEIIVKKNSKSSNVRNIMTLMSLNIKFGERVTFIVNGEDKQEAIIEIEQYCKYNLQCKQVQYIFSK